MEAEYFNLTGTACDRCIVKHKAVNIFDLWRYFYSEKELKQRDESEVVTLEEAEKREIIRAFSAVDGSHTEAAEILGISRQKLYRKVKIHGIKKSEINND